MNFSKTPIKILLKTRHYFLFEKLIAVLKFRAIHITFMSFLASFVFCFHVDFSIFYDPIVSSSNSKENFPTEKICNNFVVQFGS